MAQLEFDEELAGPSKSSIADVMCCGAAVLFTKHSTRSPVSVYSTLAAVLGSM